MLANAPPRRARHCNPPRNAAATAARRGALRSALCARCSRRFAVFCPLGIFCARHCLRTPRDAALLLLDGPPACLLRRASSPRAPRASELEPAPVHCTRGPGADPLRSPLCAALQATRGPDLGAPAPLLPDALHGGGAHRLLPLPHVATTQNRRSAAQPEHACSTRRTGVRAPPRPPSAGRIAAHQRRRPPPRLPPLLALARAVRPTRRAASRVTCSARPRNPMRAPLRRRPPERQALRCAPLRRCPPPASCARRRRPRFAVQSASDEGGPLAAAPPAHCRAALALAGRRAPCQGRRAAHRGRIEPWRPPALQGQIMAHCKVRGTGPPSTAGAAQHQHGRGRPALLRGSKSSSAGSASLVLIPLRMFHI